MFNVNIIQYQVENKRLSLIKLKIEHFSFLIWNILLMKLFFPFFWYFNYIFILIEVLHCKI